MNVYPFIEAEQAGKHNVKRACELLKVSRSAYYQHARGEQSTRARVDEELTAKIRAVHAASNGTYGAPRIHAELAEAGVRHGRKRIARLMRGDGVRGKSPRQRRPFGLLNGGEDPPRRRRGGHRTEHRRLLAQHRQVTDGLPAVGEHHRQIDRDPARIMTGVAAAKPRQHVTEGVREAGRVGQINQQPGSGVSHHAGSISADDDLWPGPGTLHPESAFRTGVVRPSTSLIVPAQKALSPIKSTLWITVPETPG